MPKTTFTVEERRESTSRNKVKWIVGPLVGIILALLGVSMAYGGLTATTGITATDVGKLEYKLESHILNNESDHDALELRMNAQDIGLAEQHILLINIDSKLDEIKVDFKDHLKGRH